MLYASVYLMVLEAAYGKYICAILSSLSMLCKYVLFSTAVVAYARYNVTVSDLCYFEEHIFILHSTEVDTCVTYLLSSYGRRLRAHSFN